MRPGAPNLLVHKTVFHCIASRKAYCSGNSKPKEQQASHVSEFIGTAAVCHLPPSHLHYQHQLTAQLVAVDGTSRTLQT
jgi:hypothetical protein